MNVKIFKNFQNKTAKSVHKCWNCQKLKKNMFMNVKIAQIVKS